MTKRSGLGRGLSSLIPVDDSPSDQVGLVTIPVGYIEPNPHQPRGIIADESLAELAASLESLGMIQPLIVTKSAENRYILIAGERRWRAAQLAGMDQVPVILKEASSQEMLEIALVENIQRDDLNTIEEANAYRQLMDEFELTQEEVAKRVGKSRSTIANIVRLLKLPHEIQEDVIQGKYSGAHARALLPLPTRESQMAIAKSIDARNLNVRQVEALVRKIIEGTKPKTARPRQLPPELIEIESQFRQSLGTRVNIHKSSSGGRIVIHFYSDEDLQVIYDAIIGDIN